MDYITTIEEESHGFKVVTLGELGKYMNWGEEPIQVGDAILEAWQPADDKAKRVLVLRVYKDGKLIAERESEMFYPNRWEVDVADIADFEVMTESVIKELQLE